MYGNEEGVGQAIASSGIARDELYVTTKLNNGFHRPDDARHAFDESLTRLGLERVDLFLIHWPLPTRYDGDFVSTWQTLVEFQKEGRATSIGVSNFQTAHLDRIIEETGVVPAVNQIEAHPFFGNEEVRAASARHGIAVEAWSPIAQGKVIGDEVLAKIGAEHGKSESQVALRWHIERGDVVFPKSMKVERMRENFEIFDFSLTPDQVEQISALDQGESGRMGPNRDFSRILAMGSRPATTWCKRTPSQCHGPRSAQRNRLPGGKRRASGDAVAFGDGDDLAAGHGLEDLESPTGPPHLQPIDARRSPRPRWTRVSPWLR